MLLTSFDSLFDIHKDLNREVFPLFSELDWHEIKPTWLNRVADLVESTNALIEESDKPYNYYILKDGLIYELTEDSAVNIIINQMKREIGL